MCSALGKDTAAWAVLEMMLQTLIDAKEYFLEAQTRPEVVELDIHYDVRVLLLLVVDFAAVVVVVAALVVVHLPCAPAGLPVAG